MDNETRLALLEALEEEVVRINQVNQRQSGELADIRERLEKLESSK